jgi:hypothetical protein
MDALVDSLSGRDGVEHIALLIHAISEGHDLFMQLPVEFRFLTYASP